MCYTSKAVGPKAHNKTQYTLIENMANGDLEAHLSGLVIIEVSSKDSKFLAHQFILLSKEIFHLLVTY